jgi:phosphoserine phosphatase
VDAVFGNSIHDFAMLEKAKSAYAVNPSAELAAKAAALGWNVYWPEVR